MKANNSQHLPKTTGLKAALLTVLFIVFTGFVLFAWQDESIFLLSSEKLVHLVFFSGMSIFLLFATLISMITSTTIHEQANIVDNTFIACSLSMILAIAELLNHQKSFDPNLFYMCSLVLNTAIVFNITHVSVVLLRVSGKWPQYLGIANSGAVLMVGMFLTNDLRMGGASEALLILGTLTHGVLAALPLVLIALTYAVPSLRLSPHDLKQSLEERFLASDQTREQKIVFYGIWLLEVFLFVTGVGLYFSEFHRQSLHLGIDPHYPLSQIHFSWIPLVLLGLSILKHEMSLNQQNSSLSALVSKQAKRFLLMHHSNMRNWSTTVGMRTANFMIDHDPNENAKAILPSYMVRIRQNQIQSMVGDILSETMMDERSVANQFFGTIDPENSTRPCTDVLLMFTTVYIDGVPMVESRLKNLVRLFPILDPELSTKISIDTIENSLGKIQWFFHLDFDWVDQHMITTTYRTDYQVSVDNLRIRDRQRILDYLQSQNLMGNFIWVGERARERIIMEAPYLSNIIEAWPIQIRDHEEQSVDSVIFLIKFEHLIPRMQKYFNLEDARKKLKYYEPSVESRRMLNIVELEIQQSDNNRNINDILALVNNYPWQGFKEKDIALDLVLKCFEKYKELQGEHSEKSIKRFVEAIQNIGYPSQEIHAAHLDKMQIRQAAAISKTCLSSHHPRFNEAWLLMATTPTRNYTEDELIVLLGTIDKAIADRTIRRKAIVAKKAPEAFFNICQELTRDHIDSVTIVANKMLNFMIESHASADQFCFFMDAKIFLESNLKENVVLAPEIINQLQAYFTKLYDQLGANSSSVISLSSRWRILMNQSPTQQHIAS
ncbi:MAG: hypothetical protein ACOH5I_21210 [Oligoflexus sp.]